MFSFVHIAVAGVLEQRQCHLNGVEGLGQHVPDDVAALGIQRLAHAARHCPGGVYAAPAQDADGVLAEFAQADAAACDVGVLLDQADDVAHGRLAVHAQQQVRAAQMEEAEGVALHDLRPVQHAAQFFRGGRNTHAQDGIARLG